jgi:pimeloyl-ACP methyl ester carboxylesterase
MSWHLEQVFETHAGKVAAGSAGSGPPLVLAHGWPWSSFAFHRIIPGLARQYSVYWYDMPGYGRSGKDPDQATSLDVQGRVFLEMMDRWGLDAPAVLAHDLGGATVLRAHLLGGFDISRCILMNVVAMRPWGSDFFEHVGSHLEAFLGIPPHIHEAIVGAYIRGALVTDVGADDLRELERPWLSEDGRISFYRQFAQADEKYTEEIEPLFGEIRCPTSILWGAEDPWIPIARGRALHRKIGKGGFRALDGLGHLPQLEDPQTVLREVLAALGTPA